MHSECLFWLPPPPPPIIWDSIISSQLTLHVLAYIQYWFVVHKEHVFFLPHSAWMMLSVLHWTRAVLQSVSTQICSCFEGHRCTLGVAWTWPGCVKLLRDVDIWEQKGSREGVGWKRKPRKDGQLHFEKIVNQEVKEKAPVAEVRIRLNASHYFIVIGNWKTVVQSTFFF